MKLFGKSKWRKVILWVEPMDWKDFDLLACKLVDKLADETFVSTDGVVHALPIFFAKYSAANAAAQRIEVQLEINWTDEELKTRFAHPSVTRADIQASGGSAAHAAAYNLSRQLRGKGEPMTKDVLHWLLNMTGYSYPQEIRLLAEEAASMAGNMEKLELGS